MKSNIVVKNRKRHRFYALLEVAHLNRTPDLNGASCESQRSAEEITAEDRGVQGRSQIFMGGGDMGQ